MKKTIFITIFVAALLLSGCTNQMVEDQNMAQENEAAQEENMIEDVDYIDITPGEAKEMIETNPDLVIIDVSPKYDEGHLPGAINYYVGDGSLDEAIPTLDKEKEYLVYCHVDSASILGSQKLIDAGFETVYRLIGNYAAWVEAGYPTEK